LESPLERASFADDPVGFFSRFPAGAVLDEVRVLTGLQQIDLVRGVTQSLAGRVALLELLPFSYAELQGAPRRPLTLVDAVLAGGYPPLSILPASFRPDDGSMTTWPPS